MPKIDPAPRSDPRDQFFTIRVSKRALLEIVIVIGVVLGLVILGLYEKQGGPAASSRRDSSNPGSTPSVPQVAAMTNPSGSKTQSSQPPRRADVSTTKKVAAGVPATYSSLQDAGEQSSEPRFLEPTTRPSQETYAARRSSISSVPRRVLASRAPEEPDGDSEDHSDEFSNVRVVEVPSNLEIEPTTLQGAGATFPNAVYSSWFSEFHKLYPAVTLHYQSIGSGGGIKQLEAGTVDFGASDGPLTNEQLSRMPATVVHIPTVMGAVVPIYNLPGISSELRFPSDVLADIFLGKIKRWNDQHLARANPGVELPDTGIVVVHRSEGCSATYIFTDFLSKVSSDWANTVKAAASVNWPVGIGGKGNEGVSGVVGQTEGALGYVDWIYAMTTKMPFGSVQNASGEFVNASFESVAAAANSVNGLQNDFAVSITNAPGRTAYPIASFTWLLVPLEWRDANKKKALIRFMNWMIDDGQPIAKHLGYAPLPREFGINVKRTIQKLL